MCTTILFRSLLSFYFFLALPSLLAWDGRCMLYYALFGLDFSWFGGDDDDIVDNDF